MHSKGGRLWDKICRHCNASYTFTFQLMHTTRSPTRCWLQNTRSQKSNIQHKQTNLYVGIGDAVVEVGNQKLRQGKATTSSTTRSTRLDISFVHIVIPLLRNIPRLSGRGTERQHPHVKREDTELLWVHVVGSDGRGDRLAATRASNTGRACRAQRRLLLSRRLPMLYLQTLWHS